MFMLIALKGSVYPHQVPVPAGKPNRLVFRTSEEWMQAMRPKCRGLKVRFFAFRKNKQWHLCSLFDHRPLKLIPDGPAARAAAEMWVMYRESEDG